MAISRKLNQPGRDSVKPPRIVRRGLKRKHRKPAGRPGE